jgi:hypothetical protein
MTVENQEKVISILNSINTEISTSVIKTINIAPDVKFYGNDKNELYVLAGSYTFVNDARANQVFIALLMDATTHRNSIEYGKLLLTENTHHWTNPLPDVVLNQDLKGLEGNLGRYE